MMATAAICTLAGLGLGALLGSATAGGFVGALVGVAVAFVVMWRFYVKPFTEAMRQRDVSHLSSKWGDDD